MAIDVGPACSDRATYALKAYTQIAIDNPANATGTIDYICYWQQGTGADSIDVASFADEGSNVLSTNGTALGLTTSATPGQNEFNAPGDFTAFNINSGEYIGVYNPLEYVEYDSSGFAGIWYINSDQIPCTSVTFSVATGDAISLYATGTEAGAGVAPTGALYGPLMGPMGGPI